MSYLKNSILILLFFTISLNGNSLRFASEMGYETEYAKALEKAKKENKPLIVVAVSKTCPWCRKLERQTLKKEEIHSKILENFVPLIVNKSERTYPKQFIPRVVPTVFFVDPKNEKAFHISLGYKNKNGFNKDLDIAISQYK